ncbi:hypothetical protein ACQJBY_054436 [Aegilops geniculata]
MPCMLRFRLPLTAAARLLPPLLLPSAAAAASRYDPRPHESPQPPQPNGLASTPADPSSAASAPPLPLSFSRTPATPAPSRAASPWPRLGRRPRVRPALVSRLRRHDPFASGRRCPPPSRPCGPPPSSPRHAGRAPPATLGRAVPLPCARVCACTQQPRGPLPSRPLCRFRG